MGEYTYAIALDAMEFRVAYLSALHYKRKNGMILHNLRKGLNLSQLIIPAVFETFEDSVYIDLQICEEWEKRRILWCDFENSPFFV